MWPFKRNKSSDNEASVPTEAIPEVPQEVTQYYESERRERIGVAWLLGLVTLLATIAVVFVIFFGGRWTYRKLTNKDNHPKPIPTVVNKAPVATPATPKPSSSQSFNTSPTPPTTSPAPTTTTAPQTSSATTQTPSPSTTPTVAANGKLANTGPGDVVAIFGFTTIAGTLFYNRRYRHQ